MRKTQFHLSTVLVMIGVWLAATSYGNVAVADMITFGSGANTFNMDFVTIGNAGNADDTTGSPNPAGSVAYEYQMGKFEVSEDMITKANAAGGLGINKNTRSAGKPATGVNWNEAARFVNWLNISSGFAPAYKFALQPGDPGYNAPGYAANTNILLWTPADTLDYNAGNPFRSLRTKYVLPSMDEWYKAAYYNPNTNSYFNYSTGSDSVPTQVSSGAANGTAVYGYDTFVGPADVNLAGGLSPYGVMGLGGNVFEWEETTLDLTNSSGASARGVRGGSWNFNSSYLLSTTRSSSDPKFEIGHFGFRVASLTSPVAAVPEPSTFGLLLSAAIPGLVCVWLRKRRQR